MSQVSEYTRLLREDRGSFWMQLRKALYGQGLVPENLFLVESCEQGGMSEFGILVTLDCRVIQYAFASSTKSWEDARFCEWAELSETWRTTPYREHVREGLELVREVYNKPSS